MASQFSCIDEMWNHAVVDLLNRGTETGSRVGPVRERLGYAGCLEDIELNLLRNQRRCISPVYACAELLWYLSFSSDVKMIAHYAPQYWKFAEANGNANGAYGARIGLEEMNQIERIITCLKNAPHSRQAVVGIWLPQDLACAVHENSKQDLPCTLSWQFIVREGKLHMMCNMRSNDIWLGMPYDIYVNTQIQKLIAGELGLGYGFYYHFVGNLHLYEKHRIPAIESMHQQIAWSPFLTRHNYVLQTTRQLPACLQFEKLTREVTQPVAELKATRLGDKLLNDAVQICAAHNYKQEEVNCHSPLLKEAYYDYRGRCRQIGEDNILSEASRKDSGK